MWTNLWNQDGSVPDDDHAYDGESSTPVDNDSDLATAWQRVIDELQPNHMPGSRPASR